jgi:hypothetical protein
MQKKGATGKGALTEFLPVKQLAIERHNLLLAKGQRSR